MPNGNNSHAATDFRLVPQGRLSIDHTYQRRLDEQWVNELAENWNALAMSPLLVSQREDGTIAVLDGQHRLAAIRKLLADHRITEESVWCEVFHGLSSEMEAAIFGTRNTHRGVNIVDRYRARVVAGEPVAMAINTILQRNDTQVDYSPINGYACVAVLEKIYGWGVLESTVLTQEQAWPRESNGQLILRARHARQMVEGTGIFHRSFHNHEAYNLTHAINRFQERINPEAVIERARNESRATKINQSVAIARMLRDAYNFHLKVRLPEVAVPRGFRG